MQVRECVAGSKRMTSQSIVSPLLVPVAASLFCLLPLSSLCLCLCRGRQNQPARRTPAQELQEHWHSPPPAAA
jgi:hypothetical protein